MTGRRRRLLLTASLSVAWFAGAATAPAEDAAKLVAAARQEGQVTWYVASIDAHSADTAGRVFTASYGPQVKVVSAPAPVMFQRLTQNLSQNAYNADVFSSMDIGNFLTLKKQGALAAYAPANEAKLSPLFHGLDKDATFHATVASVLAIVYNRTKLAPDAVPKSWVEMASPQWTDKLVLAHPAFGVYAANWAVQVAKLYGADFLKRLHALRPQIARSMPDAVATVGTGERLLTVAPVSRTLEVADKGQPLAVQYPSDGAVLVATPSAILKSAPHPNAARLFMEYLLSARFGEILVRAHYAGRQDSVGAVAGRNAADIKVIRPTVEEMTTEIPKATALWRTVFGQ